jgi:hypothetical protein
MMQIPTLIQSAKDIAQFSVALGVFFATLSFNRWQKKVGKQQFRNELYDRRLPVYLVFRELLQVLTEKGDDEIKAVFQRARFALIEVPFLFEGNPDLQACLEKVCTRITDSVINNTIDVSTRREDVLYDQDNQRARESEERRNNYCATKLKIQGEYLPQLLGKFGPFLNLSDFSKRGSGTSSTA